MFKRVFVLVVLLPILFTGIAIGKGVYEEKEADLDVYYDVGELDDLTCPGEGSFKVQKDKVSFMCDGEKIYTEVMDPTVYKEFIQLQTKGEGEYLTIVKRYMGGNKWVLIEVWIEDWDLLEGSCMFNRMGQCPHHILMWPDQPVEPIGEFSLFEKNFFSEEPPEPPSDMELENGRILEGTWDRECDILGFDRHTWTSRLKLQHAEVKVVAEFDEMSLDYEGSLALRVIPEDKAYEYDWLYILEDDQLDPDFTYFKESRFIKDYPGGYSAFEKELEEMDIDWVNTYLKHKAEWMETFLFDPPNCDPLELPPMKPPPSEDLPGPKIPPPIKLQFETENA